jgi:signal transduction histidine kinase
MKLNRDPILVVAAVLALGAALAGGLSSTAWMGTTFPGFLLLENRVVASAGLAHWPAVGGGGIYQHEVVAVDGALLSSAEQLFAHVAALPAGSDVTYRLRDDDRETERVIQTRTFGFFDFLLLFGSYLVCGLGLTGAGITVWFLGRRDPAARGSAVSLWIIGMWALTAMDLYGPYRLFRIHAFLECLLFASTIHLALVFPTRRLPARRFPLIIPIVYAAGFALGLATEIGLQRPAAYVVTHRIAVAAFGASMVVLIGSQLLALFRPESFHARQRVKVLALGTFAALTPQVVLILAAASGGHASENLMGWSGVFFPIAIGYAVLRSDLLQVDAVLRRTVNYTILTLGVTLVYAGALAAVEPVFRHDGVSGSRWASPFIFALVSVAVLLPLRDRVQQVVDRVFFRASYDFRLLVEGASRRLASVTDLRVITDELKTTVAEALQPETMVFEVRAPGEPELSLDFADGWLSDADAARVRDPDGRALELPNGWLATSFIADGRLVALLVLGRRLGGGFYGGDDRGLLHTLANQGAVAIENALALQQVYDLNRSLEQRVEERTRALAEALNELKQTQRNMVHQEKMASIGQLVAGVAHEINNPLNFIKGNLYLLGEYAEGLRGAIDGYEQVVREDAAESMPRLEKVREEFDIDYLVKDLDSLLESCNEGVSRTTTIVKDLRAFSRVDGGVPAEIDLAERLDTTLNLLRSRLTDIQIERDYEGAGRVECLEGQIDQVLMNLIVNAADAVGCEGRITVRSRALGEDRVVVEVEDDGCGIAPDGLERVFEPFYTTKEVGKGTGLGLAISYGVVSRTCFSVELPRVFPAGTLGETE